jgi:peptidoglycan/xylan/chitin deacetylase (PgdA/CDA1 family)
MFHRFLPDEYSRFAGAHPNYTVSLSHFESILDFFARFYTVVDLAAVERAAAGMARLPPCPLLITFDDGWRDTVEYALPALSARGMPAVVFVATGFIGDARGFWEERVFDAVATREGDAAGDARLAALERAGVVIGGHGHSHMPLTDVADAGAELAACRETLARHGLGGARPPFSFPHGRCTADLVAAVRAAGFGLCFTSARALSPAVALAGAAGIGRIPIMVPHRGAHAGRDIVDLAFHLVTRPHAGG